MAHGTPGEPGADVALTEIRHEMRPADIAEFKEQWRRAGCYPALLAALEALHTEALSMNADLRAIGKGRPQDGAHPDAPIELASAAIKLAKGA